jgi:hypothetical protein
VSTRNIIPAAFSFAHRNNRDGTVDSICLGCFVTIATEWSKSELLEIEKQHECEGLSIERERRISDKRVEIALQRSHACLAESAMND